MSHPVRPAHEGVPVRRDRSSRRSSSSSSSPVRGTVGNLLVALLLIGGVGGLMLVAEPPPAGAADLAPRYRPPVAGAVIDPFRAPAHRYAAGNRGIDYATTPLGPVRAAADGAVIFAGPVAGTLHVTILHADGLRTSYSFLATAEVLRGRRVVAGEVIGTSAEVFHFGARNAGGEYLDPASLFAGTNGVRWAP